MKYPNFGRFAAIIVLGMVVAVLLWFSYRSLTTRKPNASAARTTVENKSAEIVRALMPNGDWADASQLDRFDRTEAIQAISEARVTAKNERAIGLTFLLATLGDDYTANRDNLLKELHNCAAREYPEEGQCYFLISDYLMELGRRGDASLLPTLFDVAEKSDGAFSQSLGAFYSDMLAEKTEEFLKTLAVRPKKDQWDLCYAAGSEDGGGMGEGRLSEVRLRLKQFASAGDPLVATARRCLLGVEAAHEAAEKSFAEIQKSRE